MLFDLGVAPASAGVELLFVCRVPVAGPSGVFDVPVDDVVCEDDPVFWEEPVGEEFVEEPFSSARAISAVLPTQAPMPSATASAPTRPMYLALLMVVRSSHEPPVWSLRLSAAQARRSKRVSVICRRAAVGDDHIRARASMRDVRSGLRELRGAGAPRYWSYQAACVACDGRLQGVPPPTGQVVRRTAVRRAPR